MAANAASRQTARMAAMASGLLHALSVPAVCDTEATQASSRPTSVLTDQSDSTETGVRRAAIQPSPRPVTRLTAAVTAAATLAPASTRHTPGHIRPRQRGESGTRNKNAVPAGAFTIV